MSVIEPQVAKQDAKDPIDYILVYQKPEKTDDHEKREEFEKLLRIEGFSTKSETIGDSVYCKLHCSIDRLHKEAHSVKLQMPLKKKNKKSNKTSKTDEKSDETLEEGKSDETLEDGKSDETSKEDEKSEETSEGGIFNRFNNFIKDHFVTDNEVDYESAPFDRYKKDSFENHENENLFFRSALRGLLVDHILKNIDLRMPPHTDKKDFSERGLPYLLMKGVYTDAFILHDKSEDDPKKDWRSKGRQANKDMEAAPGHYRDLRHDLNVTWPNVLKFQPLWKIRNYFGEEIALYFAWAGMFITTIMIPMLIGLSVFGYGMYCSISGNCRNGTETANTTVFSNTTTSGGIAELIDTAFSVLAVIKEAFDNNGTWVYAVSICIWSTLFLEIWKRKNAVLAHKWGVVDFDDIEPNRPGFFSTAEENGVAYYQFRYKCWKQTVSFATFLFMLSVVLAVVIAVIAYRVIIKINYCGDLGGAGCFMVTTVCSSLINTTVILILGKVYEKLAVVLTNWENHRTATIYRNALIIKLFVFQFVNCYGSLYYTAFFRDPKTLGLQYGLFGQEELTDSCGTTCMPDLSFQVLVLMIVKPLPRILVDFIWPQVKRKVKAIYHKKNPCSSDSETTGKEPDIKTNFLEAERRKPPLNDFTVNEYTEKVIQYGFIVLFAAAMPLGPLIAILFNTLDRFLDSKRLLWTYRRPIANIAHNIGMWQRILDFLNMAAVVTNAFLIAYVSDWGKNTFAGQQLWFVVVFENVLFILKYSLAIIIPDVPQKIRIAMRKKKADVRDMQMEDNPQSASQHGRTQGAEAADGVDPNSVTGNKVMLNRKQLKHGGQETLGMPGGGYTGTDETESPKESTSRHQPSPNREDLQIEECC